MTWTYDATQISTNKTMQARLVIGDNIANDQQLQDEEIAFFLSVRGSIWGAAAECCRAIAANLSRQADTVQGDFRTLYSGRSKAYSARAAIYEGFAIARGGAMPYAGGISVADKLVQEQNPDRVQPGFAIGMDDNQLPVPDSGNQNSTGQNGPGLE